MPQFCVVHPPSQCLVTVVGTMRIDKTLNPEKPNELALAAAGRSRANERKPTCEPARRSTRDLALFSVHGADTCVIVVLKIGNCVKHPLRLFNTRSIVK